ncbi:hypothetical protein BEN71_10210 [Acinetobacter wuhouensis]|uniref:hypothetical protein n=1 Tax=Acinetobacter wuhouensis TaxID=1879050 RepID=UPI00083A5731|nr:hypothetical protein [Acinetobacter wuhouensis]AXQ21837.1 hypothetical protein BEN71_07070 [Acinetobacter wuhouensis]AXQ22426.1 hypothetical protein BEN71_10210 [Acinetobacter wuhouensis]
MFPIIAVVISIASAAYSYLMMRKGQKTKLSPGELDLTAADEGGSIPVIFGTCDVAPNVTAFLAETPKAIKK